ncbi:MAG: helix-turn-helix domain-containing protein [Niabella sp.]
MVHDPNPTEQEDCLMCISTPMTSVSSVREWEKLASRTFVPLTCRSREPQFHGALRSHDVLHHLTVTEVDTGPVLVRRGDEAIGGPRSLLLIVQAESHSFVSQDGRQIRLDEGAAAVLDTSRPYEVESECDQRHIVAHLALDLIDPTWLSTMTARCISSSAPLLGMITALFAMIRASGAVSAQGRQEIGRSAASLVIGLLREEATSRGSAEFGPGSALRSRMAAYIHAHLADPQLSVATLAAAHHVSERTLHNIFKAEGDAPGAFIRRERIHLARRMLEETDTPVGVIVRQCGFADATVFARAFRRQFGQSPSHWRTTVRAACTPSLNDRFTIRPTPTST